MMRRAAALTLALVVILLTACAPKSVSQGMVTADGMTFLVSTLTDEKSGSVAVTVTVTNGTGDMLYFTAAEVADTDGKTSAAYLSMAVEGAAYRTKLTPTGVTRRLPVSPRESYSETYTFTVSLPAILTVSVSAAANLSAAPTETQVEFNLK